VLDAPSPGSAPGAASPTSAPASLVGAPAAPGTGAPSPGGAPGAAAPSPTPLAFTSQPVPPAAPAAASPSTAPRLRPLREYVHVYTRRPVNGPAPPRPLPRGAVPTQPVSNQHGMITRAKSGLRFPSIHTASTLSPVPRSYRGGLADPNWRGAMQEEFDALLMNHT